MFVEFRMLCNPDIVFGEYNVLAWLSFHEAFSDEPIGANKVFAWLSIL